MRAYMRLLEAPEWYFVLLNKKTNDALVVAEDDWFKYDRDEWEVVWDSAKTPEQGYAFAKERHNADPHYSDTYKPQRMKEPTVLYRSVSIPELLDIWKTKKIVGRENRFNEFDQRRWVFFGDEITDNLMFQGEEVERQASVALGQNRIHAEYKELADEAAELRKEVIASAQRELEILNKKRASFGGRPLQLDQEAVEHFMAGAGDSATYQIRQVTPPKGETHRLLDDLRKITDKMHKVQNKYSKMLRDRTSKLGAKVRELPISSAILQTKPIKGGWHYSEKHGISGFGSDEYGFASGQVTLDDIATIRLVKDGKVIEQIPASALGATLKKLRLIR